MLPQVFNEGASEDKGEMARLVSELHIIAATSDIGDVMFEELTAAFWIPSYILKLGILFYSQIYECLTYEF